MITLLGSIVGFIASLVPELLKIHQDSLDKAHELEVMDRQIAREERGHQEQLEEIRTQGQVAETTELYKTFYSGVKWVDALTASVRPVISYGMFIVYAWHIVKSGGVWGDEDQAIFSGVISFYFGQRALRRT